MHEPPGAADLLATALKVLVEDLLPLLPPERKFAALMVANAMAIARRQVASALDPDIVAQFPTHGGAARDATPAVMLRALCSEIRGGTYDPGQPDRAMVKSYLTSFAMYRCAVSNPKALVSR